MHAVRWERVSPFIREAVEVFPFQNQAEASEFLDILTTRARTRLAILPNLPGPPPVHDLSSLTKLPAPQLALDTTDAREDWGWELHAEMVRFQIDFKLINSNLAMEACRGKVHRTVHTQELANQSSYVFSRHIPTDR